ncbi:MAG: PTS sugar transporter subunit IIA [Verrucomicrobia bacterium]|nr:PTS sugar transporter subunit IIA [Verrucomicrobiota bacterium]
MTAASQPDPAAKTSLLASVLTRSRVCVVDASNKADLLDMLIAMLATDARVSSKSDLQRAIVERESLMSTGIGLGLAVPHARLASVTDVVMAVAMSRNDIEDYESLDGDGVRLVFMIAANLSQHAEYLHILAHASKALKSATVRQRLIEAADADALYDVLQSVM